MNEEEANKQHKIDAKKALNFNKTNPNISESVREAREEMINEFLIYLDTGKTDHVYVGPTETPDEKELKHFR